MVLMLLSVAMIGMNDWMMTIIDEDGDSNEINDYEDSNEYKDDRALMRPYGCKSQYWWLR